MTHSEESEPANFNTTHWSVVVSARDDSQNHSTLRRESLESLCGTYWMPLFVYLRRKGISPDDSADYVQGFLAELVEKDFVKAVDREKGRFRWFLMSAINRFIAKQIEKKQTLKRGGAVKTFSIDLPIDLESAEQRYQNEPIDGWTPEKIFDRRWALTVLKQTLGQLETDYIELDQVDLFQSLQPILLADSSKTKYKDIAHKLGMSEVAVKVAATRIRQRYKKKLSEIVCQTLADADSLDDELAILLAALRGEN
ncbi:MAG: RNA polymerase sigma factor [Mariniblastus sp.]